MLSDIAARHVRECQGRGDLSDATSFGTAGERGEGPWTWIWLQVRDGRIVRANFDTHGCPSSVAAASMTVTLARGRTVEEALRITPDDILLVLGGLPEGKTQFAAMAVAALRNALEKEQ